MLYTGFTFLSIISFFLQMKPETSAKVPALITKEDYLAIGVPAEWIEALHMLGYNSIDKLKELEKPDRLANDLNGYKKKIKLNLPGLSPELIGEWIKS